MVPGQIGADFSNMPVPSCSWAAEVKPRSSDDEHLCMFKRTCLSSQVLDLHYQDIIKLMDQKAIKEASSKPWN